MKSYKIVVSVALALIYFCAPVQCGRILGVFPFAATSHYTLDNALMKGLAAAGHDVTVISPFEEKNPPRNGSYRNIVLTGFVERFNEFRKGANLFNNPQRTPLSEISLVPLFLSFIEATFNHSNVKALLDADEKFDVVIMEQFFNDALKVFAHHYDAPLILLSSIGPNSWVNGLMGNPSPPAYVPHILSGVPINMSFFQRLKNFIFYGLDLVRDHYMYEKNAELMKKYFPNSPDFYDINYNASIVLLNSHESLNQAVPLVPNMIEIGGYHVEPPKKLPKDLQDYLDGAKEGVVYFSLGSNLRSNELPPARRDMFLKAFSKLKQKVLWKWEDDVLPGQPANVKLGKWLPQQDILAHPNVKVFITHGGLLSTTETIYHGVPILAIPVFGDQPSNAKNAVANGYALSLPYDDPNFSEEKLSELLDELLSNPKYKENVKRRSQIFHDRPLKPMDTAIYWVEYVIRHKQAPHLRVAGVRMPLYQYFLVDVIAFILLVIVLVLFLLVQGIGYLFRKKCSAKVQKVKRN